MSSLARLPSWFRPPRAVLAACVRVPRQPRRACRAGSRAPRVAMIAKLSGSHPLSRRVLVVLALLWLAGTLRVFALWAHVPLYAYANSYDQTRYTSCFHFYPDRTPGVAPQQNSPEAPYARYRFIATGDPMCYWSSELVFTGATALVWKSVEALGGGSVHDVRWIGALRW